MFRISLILLVLFSIIPGSVAQEQDYESMIVRVQNSDVYFRFDHTPVIVCPVEGYTEVWQAATEFSVGEISAVVPMLIGENACDVFLSFVTRIPEHCVGAHIWGCTQIDYEVNGNQLRMVSTVYILQNRPEKQWLVLHELLHALGITGHSRNRADATYAYVLERSSGLSDYDLGLIAYLYRQPAFIGNP